jgi:soluble lytic murein transglycosylase-like protein
VLNPKEPLDPNLVKALIASESSFDPGSGRTRKARNAARGLMQLNSQAVKALGDEKGEIKDHYVVISGNDRYDPTA